MAKVSLRVRNRMRAMRSIQHVAMDLFETRSFAKVTVGDIAKEADVSDSTVYRYFGTKERIVVWDAFDEPFGFELLGRLAEKSPLVAFHDTARSSLTSRGDTELLLRRVKLIFRTPELQAAAVEQEIEDQVQIAQAILAVVPHVDALTADVLAGCCMAALDSALDHWQAADGSEALGPLIDRAFEALTNPLGASDE